MSIHRDRQRVPIAYDYLILATGAGHSYFGHDEFERFAPGLKSLADAVAAREKILEAFEQAEAEEDPVEHRGSADVRARRRRPTGVEMAGALAVLVRSTLRSEFRRIDPASARIVLIDMAPRVLGTFPDDLSRAAKARLEQLGVEVRLGHGVDQIDADGVIVAGERIASKTVIWTAGVAPSPAGKWLKTETDRAGRVRILRDLSVPGHPEVFVVGDTASLDQDGKPLPGVAQVAIQQGRYAGRLVDRRIRGDGRGVPAGFRYFDKGNLAVVGKGFAVLQTRQGQPQRVSRLARLGRGAPRVPGRIEPPGECLPAMGVDLPHRAAGISADRELPRIEPPEGAGRCLRRGPRRRGSPSIATRFHVPSLGARGGS